MIFVGSLKYSPVYKSHCCAFGKACEESGYSIRYLFSREYEWMLPKEVKEKAVFIGCSTGIPSMLKDTLDLRNIRRIDEVFSRDEPTHFYLHNYHFLNHFVSKMCEKHGCTFIYHAHEPYVENKSAPGGLRAIDRRLAHWKTGSCPMGDWSRLPYSLKTSLKIIRWLQYIVESLVDLGQVE